MNPHQRLIRLRTLFCKRIMRLKNAALSDPKNAERFALISISQLNNFLRAYLLSIRNGAIDSAGNAISYSATYSSDAFLIDEIMKFGQYKKWRNITPVGNMIGRWTEKDEPAYHTPRIFLLVVNGLAPANLTAITTALTDSWKIDILRSVRNYYAHRSKHTEDFAIIEAKRKYSILGLRGHGVLLEYDSRIRNIIIEDISDYLIAFATNIT